MIDAGVARANQFAARGGGGVFGELLQRVAIEEPSAT
jgi:hypothetical protein